MYSICTYIEYIYTYTVYRITAVKAPVPYRRSLQKNLYGTGLTNAYPFWPVKLTAVTVIRYGAQPYPLVILYYVTIYIL